MYLCAVCEQYSLISCSMPLKYGERSLMRLGRGWCECEIALLFETTQILAASDVASSRCLCISVLDNLASILQ